MYSLIVFCVLCLHGVFCKGISPPVSEELSASRSPYPHEALLGFGEDLETAKWLVGGSIINDRFILTAAHPTNSKLKGNINFVAVGVKDRRDPVSSWQVHKVKRVIPHPDYDTSEHYNDIALVETNGPIKFDVDVSPACLPEEDIKAETAVATTWLDLAAQGKKLADTIQEIHLENFGEEACKKVYDSYGRRQGLSRGYDAASMMCYGNRENPSILCKGLSGEPLLVEGQKDYCKYTVIGVTTFGGSCGGKNVAPDVYTRVSHYVPWIKYMLRP